MNAVLTFSPKQIRAAAEETNNPHSIVQAALEKLPKDAGAMYDPAIIDALKAIRRKDEAEYTRLTAPAKGCRTRLDKLTKGESNGQQDSYVDMILSVARENATFAHDADGAGIGLIEVGGHREVHLLNAPGFERWLRGQVYAAHQIGIPDQPLRTALATLAAIGTYEGEQIELHTRCAKHADAYYIDLCDEQWRVLRISADEWAVLDRAPVYFIRKPGMRALPPLTARGNIDLLWHHLNISADDHHLALTWLLDSLRPETPYPVLELCGEMGSSKSTTQRRLRALIDPHEVPLRARPKSIEDIHIAAANSHVCSFENLSSLSPEQQDALCILSTGGGYATRQLYTNGGEHVIQSKRPVVLNGINAVASQPDLIERVISVELSAITAAKRRDEQALEAAWQTDYPAIFTGLVALFSEALSLLPTVSIAKGMQKRMLDFQMLGESVCIALGGKENDFSKRLDTLHGDSVLRGLETYGISMGVQMLVDMSRTGNWKGTFLQLLTSLNGLHDIDRSNWPKSPRHLSSQLKRITPGLRRLGIAIDYKERTRAGANIEIARTKS